MYAALWRALPGRALAKALQCLVLFLVVIAVCFVWVFPRIAPYMPFNNATVGHSAGALGNGSAVGGSGA